MPCSICRSNIGSIDLPKLRIISRMAPVLEVRFTNNGNDMFRMVGVRDFDNLSRNDYCARSGYICDFDEFECINVPSAKGSG